MSFHRHSRRRAAAVALLGLLPACRQTPTPDPADLIPVCLSDSRCGYIHPDGREAIPFRYGLAEAFSPACGLALVFDRARETFGYIDVAGRWRIGPGYADARSFDAHGRALVREASPSGRWRLLDCAGQPVAAFDATARAALARPMATRERFSSGTAATP